MKCEFEKNKGYLETKQLLKKGYNYRKIKSLLGKMREAIQIDMGFGDIVIPKFLEMIYPTLLENEEPKIIVYSKESIIAENFRLWLA